MFVFFLLLLTTSEASVNSMFNFKEERLKTVKIFKEPSNELAKL